jgi:outer membrane protein assembly factor BamA
MGGANRRRAVTTTWVALAVGLGVLGGGFSLAGCGHSGPPLLGRGREIDEVRFVGNKRLSKGKLLDHLRAGETSWIPLTPDYPFDEALVDADMRRIEKLYEAYGYHHARVLGYESKIEDDDVVLTIRIDEGVPTKIDRIKFTWAADAKLEPKYRVLVEKAVDLAPGQVFEVPRLNAAIGAIRQELHVIGHPLAFAQGYADVHADRHRASIELEISPGPWAKIAKIRLEGLHEVPEYMVRREIRFALGRPYSPATVKQVEQAINAMRVFRWVAASPITEVKNGEMELVMRLSEAEPEQIRLGALAEFESARWQQLLSANYTHTNIFGHLVRLDLKLLAGSAQLPDFVDPEQVGPVFGVAPRFTKKGLLEDQLIWTLEPRWQMDLREGYQYHSPSNRFGVSRWFAGFIKLGLSHNLRYVDFFNLEPSFDAGSSLLGLDFRDPFAVSYMEAKASLFMADSIVSPRNGVIVETTYDFAGSVFQGDYDYQKVEGFVRGYWRPWTRLQIAARVGAGVLLPYGAQGGVPFNFKYYLGGANTVRGWGSRRLSPKLDSCDAMGANCDSTPIGGLSMVQGNFELRLRAVADLYLVGFADMGDVQAEETEFVPSEWNFSAGPGLRYDSPIGVVRLDVGFRLNDPGVYDEPPWGLYFGFGETF